MGEPLQFDRAEFDSAVDDVAACAVCKTRPVGDYYSINGKVVCATCHPRVMAARQGGTSRFLPALGLGSLAALLGAGIYYGVLAVTGYNLGLVAIVVGLLVG